MTRISCSVNATQVNPEEHIEQDARVKGYKYGQQLVPFNTVDEASLKFETTKEMKLIGFCPRSIVPRKWVMVHSLPPTRTCMHAPHACLLVYFWSVFGLFLVCFWFWHHAGQHFMGGVDILVAPPMDVRAQTMISALAHALDREDR